MISVLSTEYKTPEGGLVIPWASYSELWLALPNIPESVREI